MWGDYCWLSDYFRCTPEHCCFKLGRLSLLWPLQIGFLTKKPDTESKMIGGRMLFMIEEPTWTNSRS